MKKFISLLMANVLAFSIAGCSNTTEVPSQSIETETTEISAEVPITRRRSPRRVDSGYQHTIGLKADGSVIAVGSNEQGECNVESWNNIIEIDAGGKRSVGLRADGTVVSTSGSDQNDVKDWTDIIAISAGFGICGLKSDGTAVTTIDAFADEVSTWNNLVDIQCGEDFIAALKADGTVVALGNNQFGQCNVSDWTGITEIFVQDRNTVGLKADGSIVVAGNLTKYIDYSNVKDMKKILYAFAFVAGLNKEGEIVLLCDPEDKSNPNSSMNKILTTIESWDGIVEMSNCSTTTYYIGLKEDGSVVTYGDAFNINKPWCQLDHWNLSE